MEERVEKLTNLIMYYIYNINLQLLKTEEKIEDLTRATQILQKAKDKEYKHYGVQKKVMQKQIKEYLELIELLRKQVLEKDKV